MNVASHRCAMDIQRPKWEEERGEELQGAQTGGKGLSRAAHPVWWSTSR